MPFPKPHPPSKAFSSAPTRPSTNGGSSTRDNLPSPTVTLFLYFRLCKDTLCLWEKHADSILRELSLEPTIHEPCLYSGIINGNRVILKRQVDDFDIAAPDAKTADILLDMTNDKLKILVKRQEYLDM